MADMAPLEKNARKPSVINQGSLASRRPWDPLVEESARPSLQCLNRIRKEVAHFYAEPPARVFITREEHDLTKIHALIVGSSGTPYEGGFFQFLIRFPADYPMSPPRMRFMTTDEGRVRFNVNLYANGKVCMSSLGTAPGPGWVPVDYLSNLLVSVQSMMDAEPYFYGCKTEEQPGDSGIYNQFIQHETIRVAVCDQVEAALNGSARCPPAFREQILKTFLELYNGYEEAAKAQQHLTGRVMRDTYTASRVAVFQYEELLMRLRRLKKEAELRNRAVAAIAAAVAAASGRAAAQEHEITDTAEANPKKPEECSHLGDF
ncbi:ubiquitin-conjugating enzyme E2 Z-like [Dermacentor andersoni]|uniref:ubiquitin-conjugating enzyme E2 Z-like n=1 Tax=Dermacentor andersoni TaxID=34620 RepID=UPI002155F9D8|nr:ubiquitin-conjugating enzyme E2 Z-like [Dermacentor andersoni]